MQQSRDAAATQAIASKSLVRCCRALARCGLRGERIQGLTGVWCEGKKVAAIGVRARRWITYHGFALNVDLDLSPFADIVPCGISNRQVTSVLELLLKEQPTNDSSHDQHLLDKCSDAVLCAFGEVFDVSLTSRPVDELTPQQDDLMSQQPG